MSGMLDLMQEMNPDELAILLITGVCMVAGDNNEQDAGDPYILDGLRSIYNIWEQEGVGDLSSRFIERIVPGGAPLLT